MNCAPCIFKAVFRNRQQHEVRGRICLTIYLCKENTVRQEVYERDRDTERETASRKKQGAGTEVGVGPEWAQGVGKITDVYTMFWSTGQGLNNRVLLFLESCLLQLALCLVLLNAQGSHSQTLPQQQPHRLTLTPYFFHQNSTGVNEP